ncbi:MAG: DUF4136 domain-containing protein [Bryobacteraceae bacterium]
MNIKIHRNATHPAALCLALFLFCGFGMAQDVTWNALPGTNFSGFHTYQWANCGNAHPTGIQDAEIKQDIDANLAQKGFTKVAPETQSDLLVCYQVAVQQERQWNAYGMGGFRFGGMGTATSSTISNGTLVFDVYTMAAKQQVWQGRATKTINPSSNEQKNLKNLQNGINKLLKNFPPPVKN